MATTKKTVDTGLDVNVGGDVTDSFSVTGKELLAIRLVVVTGTWTTAGIQLQVSPDDENWFDDTGLAEFTGGSSTIIAVLANVAFVRCRVATGQIGAGTLNVEMVASDDTDTYHAIVDLDTSGNQFEGDILFDVSDKAWFRAQLDSADWDGASITWKWSVDGLIWTVFAPSIVQSVNEDSGSLDVRNLRFVTAEVTTPSGGSAELLHVAGYAGTERDEAPETSSGVQTGRVTSAGAATKLNLAALPCQELIIRALNDNEGTVAIGDASINETPASERGFLLNKGGVMRILDTDLSHWYMIPAINGEGITYVAVLK